MDIFQTSYKIITAFLELGEKIVNFLTMPLIPDSVIPYLKVVPEWVLDWAGLDSWQDITLLWVIGAGFVIFAVLTVVKWIIGIVM